MGHELIARTFLGADNFALILKNGLQRARLVRLYLGLNIQLALLKREVLLEHLLLPLWALYPLASCLNRDFDRLLSLMRPIMIRVQCL